ncbi:uncharacterized protein LOC126980809 [Eriocheir sinensis]|uniref:uncharacterized protein LOC126980809 n=1 Tax=Eriocheir sinensis TaxID=95602 RepID=UPI0021C9C1E2|nr:uncharacterized protein LOC126980809 [Eriocheir sinensis]
MRKKKVRGEGGTGNVRVCVGVCGGRGDTHVGNPRMCFNHILKTPVMVSPFLATLLVLPLLHQGHGGAKCVGQALKECLEAEIEVGDGNRTDIYEDPREIPGNSSIGQASVRLYVKPMADFRGVDLRAHHAKGSSDDSMISLPERCFRKGDSLWWELNATMRVTQKTHYSILHFEVVAGECEKSHQTKETQSTNWRFVVGAGGASLWRRNSTPPDCCRTRPADNTTLADDYASTDPSTSPPLPGSCGCVEAGRAMEMVTVAVAVVVVVVVVVVTVVVLMLGVVVMREMKQIVRRSPKASPVGRAC